MDVTAMDVKAMIVTAMIVTEMDVTAMLADERNSVSCSTNVPWKMDGEGLAPMCVTVSAMFRSWSDRPGNVTAASGEILPAWSF